MIEEKDTEINLELSQDDVEKKIKALETKLANVSSKEDKNILWGALGLFIFVISYKLFNFNPVFFIVAIPTFVFAGITLVIFENIRKKKNILIKAGLKCSKCSHLPRFINASGLYYSKQCPKCGASLKI